MKNRQKRNKLTQKYGPPKIEPRFSFDNPVVIHQSLNLTRKQNKYRSYSKQLRRKTQGNQIINKRQLKHSNQNFYSKLKIKKIYDHRQYKLRMQDLFEYKKVIEIKKSFKNTNNFIFQKTKTSNPIKY